MIKNPAADTKLTDEAFIRRHQLAFTEYFGPEYAYGVTRIGREWSASKVDSFHITARVKPVYQSTKGRTASFTVSEPEFQIWRQNVNLYKFVNSAN